MSDKPKGTMDADWDEGAANRGQPASQGTGEVHGSGAGAGGGAPEDFDETDNDAVNNDGGR